MNAPATHAPSTFHPLLWIAGIVVSLLAIVGIAALTGLLPTRSAPPAQNVAVAADPASVPAVAPTQPAASPAPTVAAPPAAAPTPAVRKPAAKTATRPLPPATGTGTPPDYAPPPSAAAVSTCRDCGVIGGIRQVTHEGKGSGLGAVAGGLLGGAVGNNFGQGNGRTLATIAGAVGGGLLGNKIEKDQKQTVSYQITVRMDDGTDQLLDVPSEPAWRVGDRVKLVNGRLVAR